MYSRVYKTLLHPIKSENLSKEHVQLSFKSVPDPTIKNPQFQTKLQPKNPKLSAQKMTSRVGGPRPAYQCCR